MEKPKKDVLPSPAKEINYQEILKLIQLMEDKKLSHFELEVEGFKIKMNKNTQPVAVPESWPASPLSSPSPAPSPLEEPPPLELEGELHFVTSPMVGTFYRAPSPNAPPFVEHEEPVSKKQTLCIIEAMKLMNEIECDVDGIIKEIYVENAKPVEYGQRLFAILKTG